MKIFAVLHGFPPETGGGTERAVEAIGRAMQRAGHEVWIVAGSLQLAPPERVDREHWNGLPVLRMHRDDLYFESWFKSHSPGISRAFAALLREHRPDVVHVHHWLRLTSDLVRQADAAGCVTAVTMHDYTSQLASPVRRAGQDRPAPPASPDYVGAAEVREAFALHRRDFCAEICAADVRCVPSRAHGEGLQEMAAAPLGALQVTPPPLLVRPPRRAAAPGPRRRRLAMWGSLYADKGLAVVLDALRGAASEWSLEVWGEAHEPEFRAAMAAAARGLPVQFRGAFSPSDLAASAADYAVLPSLCHESYGLTMDEAQFLGLPMLASDLPTYRERAPAQGCAFFAPGDPAALSALLDDEARLAKLQAPPVPAVVDADAAAAALLDLYARAAAGELPAAPVAPAVSDGDRVLALFRRAERRLWTALQQPNPPAPPDDVPAGLP